MLELLCPWEPSTYLILSSNVPTLIYYSHAVAIVSALGIGSLIFANNPRDTVPRLILLFVSLFSIWAALDVILWATNRPDVVMFSWSLQVLIEPLTYTLAFYLFYLFLYKRWPDFKTNFLIILLLLPLLVFLPTTFNLEALLLSACEAIEGPIAKYYTYAIHLIFMLAIAIIGAQKIPTLPTRQERAIALYFGFGLVTFLLSFTSGNIFSSFTDDWTISQYGLFGMPVFAALIAYSIVQFKAFNAKVIAAQMLVVILVMTVISFVTLRQITSVRIVAAFTFVLVCVLGYILVRSVKREVAQREHIEKLAAQIEVANERLKDLDRLKSEFLSIASHQLRAPITAIRGYTSLIIKGDYGPVPEKMKDPLDRVTESARVMASSIEDYLNISRIEQGSLKYEFALVDIASIAQKVVEEMRPIALAKHLALNFSSKDGALTVQADFGKIKQVFSNLVDNAIKYTKEGSVSVTAEKAEGKIRVTIADTGIGIAKEDLDKLFAKFTRAKDANKINTTGTGLGLYVAKQLVEGHKGTIRLESEGLGKGARFVVELPV